MPTYQYRCADCSEELEKFQHFTDDPLTRCPACGHEALRKVFSPVGIVFKGSGFYATDNRTKGKVNAAAPAHDLGAGQCADIVDRAGTRRTERRKIVGSEHLRCLTVQTAYFRAAEGHHQLHPTCLTPIVWVIGQSPEEVGYSGRKGSDSCLKIAGRFWPRWHCTSLYAV